MAIVTRRYMYEGPPLDAIRNQTDPGLTVAAPALKLEFDATFDDAVADVAAVDQAMAAVGLVPDLTADTSVPPSFPGGGSSNALVFRPGSGLPGPIVFDAWADLMAELANLRSSANGGGNYTIQVDDSIVSPAVIPAGAYDMSNVALEGLAPFLTSATVVDGVSFTNLRKIANLAVNFTGATPPVSDFAASGTLFIMDSATVGCTGTGPFFRSTAGPVFLAMLTGSVIATGSTQTIDIAIAGPKFNLIAFDSCQLQPNSVSGIAGASFEPHIGASSAALSEDQPALTGPGGAIALNNDTLARFFSSDVLTVSTPIVENQVARCDTTGGPITVTLPPAFDRRGAVTIVKDVGGDASGNPITVMPTGADTVDGNPSAILNVDKGALRLVSDGVSDWMIV